MRIFNPSDMEAILADLNDYQKRQVLIRGINRMSDFRKHMYDDIFGDKDELVIGDVIEVELNKEAPINENLIKEINKLLKELEAYFPTTYERIGIDNLETSSTTDNNNREIKLSKIVSKVENLISQIERGLKDPSVSPYKMSTLKPLVVKIRKALNARSNSLHQKLKVIVTKDPYDVARMSTDQNWVSCMRLPERYNAPKNTYGEFHDRVYEDIRTGTLIAYLVNEKDENAHGKARARFAIKPLFDPEQKHFMLVREPYVYHDGSFGKDSKDKSNNYSKYATTTFIDFADVVDNWISDVNEKLTKDVPLGTEFTKPKWLYDDSYGQNSNAKLDKKFTKSYDIDSVIETVNKYYNNEIDKLPYSVGDIVSYKRKKYTIIGIDHDTLAEPINGHNKAALTLQDKSATQMKLSTTRSSYVWDTCSGKKQLLKILQMYDKLYDNAKTVIKTTASHIVKDGEFVEDYRISNDKIFVLSAIESMTYEYIKSNLTNKHLEYFNKFEKEGSTYEFYKTFDVNIDQIFRTPVLRFQFITSVPRVFEYYNGLRENYIMTTFINDTENVYPAFCL